MIKERIPISGDLKSKVRQLMGEKWTSPLRSSITPTTASR